MTRGQLSRAARERQQEVLLYRVIGGIAVLALLIIGYAAYASFIQRPNEELANVGGKSISRSTYEKLRRYTLYNQELISQQLGSSSSASGLGSPSDYAAQLLTVDKDPIDGPTVDQLVQNEVQRQKAASDLKVTVNADEVKQSALKDFIPSPTPPTTPEPSPTLTNTTGITPTNTLTTTAGPPTSTPTITPTLPPVPGASATAVSRYKAAMDSIQQGAQVSEQDYLDLVAEPNAVRQKVTDKLGETISTTVEAIHPQRIVTDTEQGALLLINQLKGGTDFSQLANVQSSEMITKELKGIKGNGGDLSWVDRDGNLLGISAAPIDKKVVDAAWPLKNGQFTDTPISTTLGYTVVKLIDRNLKFPLTQDEINNKKSQAFSDWLQKAQDSMKAANQIRYSPQVPQTQQAQPTQPAIIPPTQAPATTPPAGGSGATTPGAATTPATGAQPPASGSTPATGTGPSTPQATSPPNTTPGPKP